MGHTSKMTSVLPSLFVAAVPVAGARTQSSAFKLICNVCASFYQDTIELLQARVSALDSATLDQVEARLQVTILQKAQARESTLMAH